MAKVILGPWVCPIFRAPMHGHGNMKTAVGQRAVYRLSKSRNFLLDISTLEMVFLLIGYLILAVLIYFITVGWVKLMYGKYLRNLEVVIEDLEA